jgi:hypothetical protein
MFSPTLHSLLSEASLANTTRLRRPPGSAPPVGHHDASATRPTGSDSQSTRRFVRHYAEMVVVMFLGMFTLMAPTGLVLGAIGTSWSRLSPAMNVFMMALTMTVPMAAWMRYRGHAWRANLEMAASMLIPTFVVMTLLWAGASTGGALVVPEHVAMLICMLVAMLLRPNEYDCATDRNARPAMAS